MEAEIVIEKIQTKAEMDVCLDINTATFEPKYLTFSKYGASGVKEMLGLEIHNPFSIYNFLVAKCDDEIVGFAELRQEFPIANLNWLALEPAQKGKNIGRYFMQHIIDTTRDNGFKVLQLHVYKSNMRARNWMANYPYVYTEERNVCRLIPNQKGSQPAFTIVNYHQLISDLERFGFVYIRVLFEKKIIDIACINNNLFIPTGNEDILNIGLSLIEKLKLKEMYFFCDKDKQIKLKYEVIDEIYSLVMDL
ncbi:MAG: GNAT family N-acetyltransferase [Paludibacter sp.]